MTEPSSAGRGSSKALAVTSLCVSVVALCMSIYFPATLHHRQQIVSNQQSCITQLAELHSAMELLRATGEDSAKQGQETQAISPERAAAQQARDKTYTLCANVRGSEGTSVIVATEAPWNQAPKALVEVWPSENISDIVRWSTMVVNDLSTISPPVFAWPGDIW